MHSLLDSPPSLTSPGSSLPSSPGCIQSARALQGGVKAIASLCRRTSLSAPNLPVLPASASSILGFRGISWTEVSDISPAPLSRCFKAGSCCVAQAGFRFRLLPPLSPAVASQALTTILCLRNFILYIFCKEYVDFYNVEGGIFNHCCQKE